MQHESRVFAALHCIITLKFNMENIDTIYTYTKDSVIVQPNSDTTLYPKFLKCRLDVQLRMLNNGRHSP